MVPPVPLMFNLVYLGCFLNNLQSIVFIELKSYLTKVNFNKFRLILFIKHPINIFSLFVYSLYVMIKTIEHITGIVRFAFKEAIKNLEQDKNKESLIFPKDKF